YGGNVGIRYGFGGNKKKAEEEREKKEVPVERFKEEAVEKKLVEKRPVEKKLEAKAIEERKVSLYEPIELGKTISIGNAHFAYGKAELSEGIKAELSKKGGELKKMKYERIVIVGHTDSTGSDIVNNRLSERRAEAVAEYLIESGAERDKVEYWGEGSKKPIASNDTKEGRAQNRRVEVTVR
ncbi:MAG: OmpA family protein, partial [Elusimicrobiota bacterium]|nr:OmpA family protein [Elusimicrobiota bacterium]